MCRRTLLAVALLAAMSCGAQRWAGSVATEVDQIAQEALRSGSVAGISIAVGTANRIVFAKGYGKADLEHDVPVTTDTLFQIQSVTKSFWAASFLQLAEEKKIALDQEISTLLPDVPAELGHIRVRHLLSHTAGFHFDDDKGTSLTPNQWSSRLAAQHLLFAPGSNWLYSNIGWDYADYILARVSGLSDAEYFRRNIFDPLAMTHSALCHAEDVVPHRATPYALQNGNFVHVMTPQATAYDVLCSTPTDVLRFLQALNTGKLISPESVRLMRTPTELADGVSIDYGLGMRMGWLHGHRLVGHTGDGDGWTAAMEYYSDDDLSIVVLTNTASPQHARVIAQRIAEKLLGLSAEQPRKLPSAELTRWAGSYTNAESGTIGSVRMEVSTDGERLVTRMIDMPNASKTLYQFAVAPDRFCLEALPSACAHFVRGKQYRWMELYNNGFFLNLARSQL